MNGKRIAREQLCGTLRVDVDAEPFPPVFDTFLPVLPAVCRDGLDPAVSGGLRHLGHTVVCVLFFSSSFF